MPGWTTNDTYYSVYDVETQEWHAPTNGIATMSDHDRTTFSGPPCTSIETNLFWSYSIPFPWSMQYNNGACSYWISSTSCYCDKDDTCDTICQGTVLKCPVMWATWFGGQSSSQISYVFTTNSDSLYTTKQVVNYSGIGYRTNLMTFTLSTPLTLTTFASATLEAARNGYWANAGYTPNSSAQLTTSDYRSIANATLTRYYIEFKSKRNADMHVKWKAMLISNGTTNLTEMEWFGKGDGTKKSLGPYTFRDPQIDEAYTVKVLDVEVEIIGDGCTSLACDDDDPPGDGEVGLASASLSISLGSGNFDGSAGSISMDEENPSPSLATPAVLSLNINTNLVAVWTNGMGTVTHLAAPTMLARIEVTNAFAYWIHCSATNSGNYLTNTPFISHLIINPNGSTR